MEVLVGITFTIDVLSSPPPSLTYGGDQPDGDTVERRIPSSFLDGRSGYRVGGQPEFLTSVSPESSSSIGTPDDNDDQNDDNDDQNDDVSSKREEEEEEVQSKLKGLGSLDSLEDSLPIKRGLSSHFVGKSKSFTDLSQVSTVKELQKQENPFNKRRRVLIVSKWSRRSSFYSWSNLKSMPLLPVDEEEDDYDEAEDKVKKVSPSSSSSSSEEKKPEEDQAQLRQLNRVPQSYATHMRLRLGSLKSRSFSLADLQEHDNDEEEEEEEEDNDN